MNYYRRLFHGVSITAVGNSTNHGVQNVQNIYHYVNSFVIDIQGKFEIEAGENGNGQQFTEFSMYLCY